MRPAKVYLTDDVTINSPKYRDLAKAFEKEGSFLGSNKDKDGLHIIIDLDKSNIIKPKQQVKH
jgi:hypothetical protein